MGSPFRPSGRRNQGVSPTMPCHRRFYGAHPCCRLRFFHAAVGQLCLWPAAGPRVFRTGRSAQPRGAACSRQTARSSVTPWVSRAASSLRTPIATAAASGAVPPQPRCVRSSSPGAFPVQGVLLVSNGAEGPPDPRSDGPSRTSVTSPTSAPPAVLGGGHRFRRSSPPRAGQSPRLCRARRADTAGKPTDRGARHARDRRLTRPAGAARRQGPINGLSVHSTRTGPGIPTHKRRAEPCLFTRGEKGRSADETNDAVHHPHAAHGPGAYPRLRPRAPLAPRARGAQNWPAGYAEGAARPPTPRARAPQWRRPHAPADMSY